MIDLSQKSKTNWRVFERAHIYPQAISAYLELMHAKPSQNKYISNYNEVITYSNDYFWWAMDSDLLEKTAREWINSWLTDKEKLDELFGLYDASYKETMRVLPNLRKQRIVNLTDKQLFPIYNKSVAVFFENILFSEYTIDIIDDFFAKIFSEKLKGLTKNKVTEDDLVLFLEPACMTASSNYRKRLLEISLMENADKSLTDAVVDDFSWIMMSWDGSNELTKSHVEADLAELNKISADKRKLELGKINGSAEEVDEKRKDLIKKYNLSDKIIRPYFLLLDNFIKFHDWRKENQIRALQINMSIVKELAVRHDISQKDILFYYNHEIKELCLNGNAVLAEIISKRRKGMTFVIKDETVKEYVGDDARKMLDLLVLNSIKSAETDEIKGMCASKGNAKGKAFVTKNAKDANSYLKKGEILITSMTTIDYLPAMKRAGAIITDDGGITCHAAIVSRELGIPCVIGTKVATNHLKTGDLIEVDADNGIVRKIK